MAITRKYPKYKSHGEVICFNCGTQIDPKQKEQPSVFDFPEGRYSKVCQNCGMRTFYDIKE